MIWKYQLIHQLFFFAAKFRNYKKEDSSLQKLKLMSAISFRNDSMQDYCPNV